MQGQPFWQAKQLKDMSNSEWESLCDGCGKCCVLKLEDVDTAEIYYTDVGCKLLDCESCRCLNYADRKKLVPDCVVLTPDGLDALHWMPKSCAYRLVNEGKNLPAWHPLVSGDPESVHRAGISVRGRVVSETLVDDADLEAHIVKWPE